MANDWKSFVVTPLYLTDLNDTEYVINLPPSWKTELLIWDILEKTSGFDIKDYETAFDAVDSVCKILALLLNFPPSKKVEDLFDSGTIEATFAAVWNSIVETAIATPKTDKTSSKSSPPKADDFNLAQALAMFACECGWMPEQVLSLPKIQVMQLTQAISEYAGHRLRFQAAIHGCPIDSEPNSASSVPNTQIDIERQLQDFQAAGLPIEVM